MTNIEVIDSICILTLNNPPHNYLSQPEFTDTRELIHFINNNQCKALIIKGEGRHFSAGANLDELKKMIIDNTIEQELTKGKQLISKLLSANIPIIAAIEGSCMGGGLEIALQADIKIASSRAFFAFPEAGLDLIPGMGGTINLPAVTGKVKALELILKSDIINAETAKELGIIDEISEPKQSFNQAFELAKSLITNRNLMVIKAITQSVRNAFTLDFDEAMHAETLLFSQLAKEAIKNNV